MRLTRNGIKDNEVDDLESKNPRWTFIDKINSQNIGDLGKEIYEVITKL